MFRAGAGYPIGLQDTNGDNRIDLLVFCQIRSDSTFPYGEVINTGGPFCVRRANAEFSHVCTGTPSCAT